MARLKQTPSDSAVNVELAKPVPLMKTLGFLNTCWFPNGRLIEFSVYHRISETQSQRLAVTIPQTHQTISTSLIGWPTFSTSQTKTSHFKSITEFSVQTTAWTVLYQLTSPGRIAFETAASLRPGRLARHLEEPLRSQARHKMKPAFKFRKLTKPSGEFTADYSIFCPWEFFNSDVMMASRSHSPSHCTFPQPS